MRLVAALALAPATWAHTDETAVAAISAALEEYNRHAHYALPVLNDRRMDRLVAGKVVKIRERFDGGPQRAVGMQLVDHPREHLFLAASDPHSTAVAELVEVKIGTHEGYPYRWYQHLDLPRPIADRHWVIDITDNVTMAAATADRCWEHWWRPAPDGAPLAAATVAAGKAPGITVERAEDAIFVDVNDGAWFYITVPDRGTILGFHARTVVGGRIPDRLISEYTLATLGRVLSGVVKRVPEAVAHYDAAHEPMNGGNGQPIAPHGERLTTR